MRKSVGYAATLMVAEIAFGDSLYGSLEASDAQIEREGRRARWQRRKATK